MTFTHDDIRERLVDYLYGELDGELRAAFQAHLIACAACRVEVAGAEQARTLARGVVRRPLGEAVPERVRAQVLEAARAAVAARAVAPAQAKVAVAAASPAPVADGWFKRLRRRWTWTLPTFATVAAMAVFLLVRATIFREAKNPVSEERAEELAKPAAAPRPAPDPGLAPSNAVVEKRKATPKKAAAPRDADEAPAADHGSVPAPGGDADGLTGTGAGALRMRPSAASGGHPHRQPIGGGVSSPGAASNSGAAVAQPAPSAVPVRKGVARGLALPEDRALDDLDSEAKVGQGRARGQDVAKDKAFGEQRRATRGTSEEGGASAFDAPSPAKKVAPEQAAPAGKRDFAVPPPPPAAAPQPPASAAASAPPAQSSAPVLMEREVPSAPEAKLDKESKKESTTKSKKSSKTNQDNEPIAPPAPAAEQADQRAAPAVDPALTLASRADGLMHARRWNDAIAAYRELLRRYPAHPAVPVWRQRLASAQAALAADTGQFATPPPR